MNRESKIADRIAGGSPKYNISNFRGYPKQIVCRKCGKPTKIAQLKANGKWIPVDEKVEHGVFSGDNVYWVWHECGG